MNALIWVDLQNDFCPGGALAVREGDQVVPIANMLANQFNIVVATQDWHPPDHQSFARMHRDKNVGDVIDLCGLPQMLWPPHCIADTHGAAFVGPLNVSRITKVFHKGTDPTIDNYSGFFDNGHRKSTGMGDWLRVEGVTRLVVLGLATDYCVKFTALDAMKLGFETTLITDACRGVELKPGDVQDALNEMASAGVVLESSDRLLRKLR